MASKKNGVPKLDGKATGDKEPSGITGSPAGDPTAEEHVPMFASQADKDAFFAEFGKQPYYRGLIRAAGKLPVTFEEAKLISEKGRAHLRALAGRVDDGKEGTCVLGVECQNPKYRFVPKAGHILDWSNSVDPKRAVLKLRGDNEEFVTLLKVTDGDNKVKTYHQYADGRITVREEGKTVVLPDNEAEIVREAAEPVYLFDGHYYADEENLDVIGPVCHLCMKRAEELAEQEGARKPRFTSLASATDMVARAKGRREYAARQQERLAHSDQTIGSRFVRKGLISEGRPGSRKMRNFHGAPRSK